MSKYTPPDPTAGSASVASKGWTSKSPGLTASSKCGNSCWIGSEGRETAWTVICTQPPVPVRERQVHRPEGGSDSLAHDFGRQHERGQPAGAVRPFTLCICPAITELTRAHSSMVGVTVRDGITGNTGVKALEPTRVNVPSAS
jgi:hypothetical protein